MSLTRVVFVDINFITGAVYKEFKIPPHERGTTHSRFELLYGNKCRCGIFGGMARVTWDIWRYSVC